MIRNRYTLFLAGLAALAFTSCSTSIDIAKRQHRPGYYISWGSKNNTAPALAEKTERSEAAPAVAGTVEDPAETAPQHIETAPGTESTLPSANKVIASAADGKKKTEVTKKVRVELPNPFSKKKSNPEPMGDDGTALWSILSFLFSILGLIPFPISMLVLGLLAIIFGLIGVNQKAKWLAIIGIIAGILEVLVGFVLFSLVLALF